MSGIKNFLHNLYCLSVASNEKGTSNIDPNGKPAWLAGGKWPSRARFPEDGIMETIPNWPLPAVRDGRLSTYDDSVLKLSNVSFRGKCARMGHPLKLPSPTNPARLGHFPPPLHLVRRTDLPARCSMLYLFSDDNFVDCPVLLSPTLSYYTGYRQ